MPGTFKRAFALLSAAVLCAAIAADAQAQYQSQSPQQSEAPAPRAKVKAKVKKHRAPRVREREPGRERETREKPAPAAPPDKRDSVIVEPGSPYNGRAYWQALSQCGGIYFKLNTLYTEVAVRARSVKPDPKANAEYTKKLGEAIKTATAYFDGAERLLMADRGIERIDAVMTFDGRSRESGERAKTVDAALAAAKSCFALYKTCRDTYPKACTESNLPIE
jgi:hypothetical protein